ncbi:MAG: helix-turn-helix domain-containing protein [Spirochaetia bacterium]|nr:helix-turn-helix domain-containing protein [Spirochaetia bacterium]
MSNGENVVLSEKQEKSGSKQIYTINEVALMLNVHQQTLRNWERKKVIVPLRAGSRRIYTHEHIELCKKIKEYSGKGVPLKCIKMLMEKIQGGTHG